MSPPLDLSKYVPVICVQEDSLKYNGKCFMESILKVQMLNGEPISADRQLVKPDFLSGDEVVITFKNKNFVALLTCVGMRKLLQNKWILHTSSLLARIVPLHHHCPCRSVSSLPQLLMQPRKEKAWRLHNMMPKAVLL